MDSTLPIMLDVPNEIQKLKNYIRNRLKRAAGKNSIYLYYILHTFIKKLDLVESSIDETAISNKNDYSRIYLNVIGGKGKRMKKMLHFKSDLAKYLWLIQHELVNQAEILRGPQAPFFWSRFAYLSMLFDDQYMKFSSCYASSVECRIVIQHEYRSIPSPMSTVLLPRPSDAPISLWSSLRSPSTGPFRLTVPLATKAVLEKVPRNDAGNDRGLLTLAFVPNNENSFFKDTENKGLKKKEHRQVKQRRKGYKNKLWISFVLVLVFCSPCESSSDIDIHKTLRSDRCERGMFLTKPCPMSDYNLKLIIQYCEFPCDSGLEPQCIPVEEGSVYICAKTRIICQPGVKWTPFIKERDASQVMILKGLCPSGFYQLDISDCFDACRDKHKDISKLPVDLLLYSVGDVKSESLVYCNYLDGYFNKEGRLTIGYDHEFAENPYFCSDVAKVGNPCTSTQQLLPNGTCASQCEAGKTRDAYSNFTCQISRPRPTTKEPMTDTSSITLTVISSTQSAKTTVFTTVAPQSSGDVIIAGGIVAGGIAGVILIIGAIALVIYCVRHKNRNGENVINTRTLNQNCVTYNVLADAETGTVNFMNANSDVSDVAITRTSSGDTGFPSHGSEFDQSPDEVSTESGTSESGYLEERNGQQVHDLVGVEAIRQPNMAEEDSEETECKTPYLPQITGVATPVNVVKPMERQDDVRMKLLKDFEE